MPEFLLKELSRYNIGTYADMATFYRRLPKCDYLKPGSMAEGMLADAEVNDEIIAKAAKLSKLASGLVKSPPTDRGRVSPGLG